MSVFGRGFWEGFQQIGRGGAEGFGDQEDVLQRDVALCAFDGADIGAVQAGTVSQLLLGDAGRGSQTLQIEGQNLLRSSNGDGPAFRLMEGRLEAV